MKRAPMLNKSTLNRLYVQRKLSMQAIAHHLRCSVHKVQYWMERYGIRRRSISDAIYLKHNPDGDPFRYLPPKTHRDYVLFGLGLGLYWGEGTRANRYSIRLGNTDPLLLMRFIEFLERFFSVKRADIRFGLQIFTDTDPCIAMRYWIKNLDVKREQFGRVVVTRSGSLGTYRRKSQYGVVTVYYHNRKLRDLLISLLPA